jgi:hypothetical protein
LYISGVLLQHQFLEFLTLLRQNSNILSYLHLPSTYPPLTLHLPSTYLHLPPITSNYLHLPPFTSIYLHLSARTAYAGDAKAACIFALRTLMFEGKLSMPKSAHVNPGFVALARDYEAGKCCRQTGNGIHKQAEETTKQSRGDHEASRSVGQTIRGDNKAGRRQGVLQNKPI